MTNSPTTAKKTQSVLQFDGIDDQIKLSKGFPSIDQEITIEFWAKGQNKAQETTSIFCGYNASKKRLVNAHFPWGGQIYWDAGDEKGAFDRINKKVNTTDYNVWTHWAFIKNVSNKRMLIYRNGAIWHQGNNTSKSLTGIDQFVIGCFLNDTCFWKGYLTEFRIWNTVRTAAEIRQNMNDRLIGNEQGLVGYYPFNGDANDKTSNANHGTITGATWSKQKLSLSSPEDGFKVATTESTTEETPEPEIKYVAATGLEDYGRWKSMFHDRKSDPKKPFRRGRIWC